MTAPIAPTAPTAPTTPTTGTSSSPLADATVGGPMGKDQFIKLLVAQMTHQDPLNPTDGAEMAAQLAQFSSVEQLMNIGDKLDAQATANTALMGVINNGTAMNLLGKDVTVNTDAITVGPNATTQVSTDVPAGGGPITLRITDANGVTLRTTQLGFMAAGTHTFQLADATKDLPAGDYHVAIDCQQASGVTSLTPRISVHVDGVRFGSDGALITSGTHTYPIGLIGSISSTN